MHVLEYIDKLNNNDETKEVFGKVSIDSNSWFRFVRYGDKIHIFIRYNEEKIELYDEFDVVKKEVSEWLVERV